MEKLEIWFLERFTPWFLLISKDIGILAIFSVITYFAYYFWEWSPPYVFGALLSLSFLTPRWIRNIKIERIIKESIKDQEEELKIITDKKGIINYVVLNEITTNIITKLENENALEISSFEIKEEINREIREKIDSLIWQEFRKNKL